MTFFRRRFPAPRSAPSPARGPLSPWRSAAIVTAACVVSTLFGTPANAASGQTSTDALYIYTQSGIAQGTITPSAPYTLEVKTGATRKKVVSGRAKADGTYSAAAGYHDGVGVGAHNGDTYVLTDQASGRQYVQTVQLWGMLDERTGMLIGRARPNATVRATLARVYYAAGVVAESTVQADAAGDFRVDWASLHTPAATADRPSWRGYTVTIEGRDVGGQGAYRSLQTPAPGLNWTANSGGGGYFKPGDTVVHELWNGTTRRASVTTTVNADGVPRSTFPVNVIANDVFRTRYHDTKGLEQVIDLEPYVFTATVDVHTRTVRGKAAPNAPILGILDNEAGDTIVKGVADTSGNYEVTFDAMEWGRMLTMYRGADPGYTGIGMHAITMYTPQIRVDDLTGAVTGHGASGANSTTVVLRRNGTAVQTVKTSTNRSGKFSTKLTEEIVPGDRVEVTTGSFAVPTLDVPRFDVNRSSTLATAPFRGTAAAGWGASVSSTTCTAAATADATGAWSATPSCAFQPADYVVELASPNPGLNAGSVIGRFQWVTSPDVAVTSPAPLARTGTTVTLSADAFDHDDNAAPAEVHFVVDGKTVAIDKTAPYSATVTVLAGTHKVWVQAIDSQRRTASDGKIIAGTTPARTFTAA